MNSRKRDEENLFLQHSPPQTDPSYFSIHEINVFPSSSSFSPSDSPPSHSSSDSPQQPQISPDPHISSQFYTFNSDSHSLMIRCLLQRRLATPVEIRAATARSVLNSWRSVWKDRNEETAYLTAWKRIQDKLSTHVDPTGNTFLCFKNNSQQFVSHVDQWQDIVTSFHGETDMRHFGVKETIERIKQVWTVGAKFYGIPESFIRVCVAACRVCSADAVGSAGGKSKRRRFEYTESFDVPAMEVPSRLQQLAVKHKVVLCIRQKYIRCKPFMAEVKDYACHRAGEPAPKKSKILKREPYASKRCGCGFRIRAIVPIANYNEKDKSFVYQEEGMAVFKLYAVHSGHEPGPLDGNARIMHRVVGHKGSYMMDHETVYGVSEEMDSEGFGLMGKDDGDLQFSVLQQMQELKAEVGMLEVRVSKIPDDDVLAGDNDLANWSNHHHDRIYGDGKDTELIEDDEDSFGRTLGEVVSWDRMSTECRSQKDLLIETCKPEKWLKCGDFVDEKIILGCEDTKLTKPIRHDEAIVSDVGLGCIQVDSFYQDNPKWFDSPCGLDTGADCGDSGFRHGEIL
ncbi:hypothetical protein Lalb_Chr07g0189751 [Lupinus albus]|uniref:Uncharacterized protein n=1 Tax=Lupinus albus TaxID=3870 RepID=A0A6A4QBP4_LUPAL|nr:hypothetical protein Lalb_Chr07g0189751 [Lupinus albus]